MFDMDKIKNIFSKNKEESKDDNGNINRSVRKKQMNNAIIVIVCIFVVFIFLGAILHHGTKKQVQHTVKHKTTVLDGILSSDFNQKNTTSALEEQQREVDSLKQNMQKNYSALNKSMQKTIEAAIAKSKQPKKTPVSKKPVAMPVPQQQMSGANDSPMSDESYHSSAFGSSRSPMQEFSFSYSKKSSGDIPVGDLNDANKISIKNYVPAGTFARGVLLEGADADASTNGQSNTEGVLIRLLDNGTTANKKHSKLKGCFIVASIYGDISSERGEVRLDKLSCTKKDGSIIEKDVQGYVSFAGKQGVRGRVVSRNGKLLMSSAVAGTLSGIGSALQQSLQTVNQSPLGTTTTVPPNQVGKAGLYGGASNAMSMLANYYIKSANNIHPIIEIPSGTAVTVIFQSGFSLLGGPDDGHSTSHTQTSSGLSKKEILQFMAHAKTFSPTGSSDSSDQPFSSVN